MSIAMRREDIMMLVSMLEAGEIEEFDLCADRLRVQVTVRIEGQECAVVTCEPQHIVLTCAPMKFTHIEQLVKYVKHDRPEQRKHWLEDIKGDNPK